MLCKRDNPLSSTSCHPFQSSLQSSEGKSLEHILQWSLCTIYSVAIKHVLEVAAIITSGHSDTLQLVMQQMMAPMCAKASTAAWKGLL